MVQNSPKDASSQATCARTPTPLLRYQAWSPARALPPIRTTSLVFPGWQGQCGDCRSQLHCQRAQEARPRPARSRRNFRRRNQRVFSIRERQDQAATGIGEVAEGARSPPRPAQRGQGDLSLRRKGPYLKSHRPGIDTGFRLFGQAASGCSEADVGDGRVRLEMAYGESGLYHFRGSARPPAPILRARTLSVPESTRHVFHR